jgi:hypothetical protein
MVAPVLQVPGLKQSVNQVKKPAVADLLGQYRSHDRMVQGPETIGDITLDEPHRSAPLALDLIQCGVTAAASPETMERSENCGS